MSEREQAMRIATTLEGYVAKIIADGERYWGVLKLPARLRATLWRAIARRAEAKAAECEREAGR